MENINERVDHAADTDAADATADATDAATLRHVDPDLQALETELQEKPTLYTNNTQSKAWLLTFNNYSKHGYDYDNIQTILHSKFKTLVYYALCKEIAETGTPHIHLYLACSSNIRFSMIQKHLPKCHILKSRATAEENRSYLRKEGEKHKAKACTSVPDSFLEWGDISKCARRQGERTDLVELYEQIKCGMSTYQILENNPNHMKDITTIERTRLEILSEKYKTVFRELETTYIWGATNTNKTRSVMDKYGYANVFRITNYSQPWDTYKGQQVVVMEEFNSQFDITDFNNYADSYPCTLKARFYDKHACYTKLYIISNIDIINQYPDMRVHNPALWAAFARRVHTIRRHFTDGTIVEMPLVEYLKKRTSKHNTAHKLNNHMTDPPWHLVKSPLPAIQQKQPESEDLHEI